MDERVTTNPSVNPNEIALQDRIRRKRDGRLGRVTGELFFFALALVTWDGSLSGEEAITPVELERVPVPIES